MTRQTPKFLMPLSKVASSIRRQCDRGCVCVMTGKIGDEWLEWRRREGWRVNWGVLGLQAGRGGESVDVMRRSTFYPRRPGKRWCYWRRGREQKNNPLSQFTFSDKSFLILQLLIHRSSFNTVTLFFGWYHLQIKSESPLVSSKTTVYKTASNKIVLQCHVLNLLAVIS